MRAAGSGQASLGRARSHRRGGRLCGLRLRLRRFLCRRWRLVLEAKLLGTRLLLCLKLVERRRGLLGWRLLGWRGCRRRSRRGRRRWRRRWRWRRRRNRRGRGRRSWRGRRSRHRSGRRRGCGRRRLSSGLVGHRLLQASDELVLLAGGAQAALRELGLELRHLELLVVHHLGAGMGWLAREQPLNSALRKDRMPALQHFVVSAACGGLTSPRSST